MTGFFTNIQSKFRDGSYAGRYLAVILAELANSTEQKEKESFFKIIRAAGVPIEYQPSLIVTTEKHFPGMKQNRRADLAIVQGSKIIALIEIKDEDGKQKPNDAQLRDYVAFLKRKHQFRPWLVFISKYPPRREDHSELIRGGAFVKQIRYSAIHKALGDSDLPLSCMIRDYLEEKGVTYRELNPDDANALGYLAQRSLGGLDRKKGLLPPAKTRVLGAATIVDILLKDALAVFERLYSAKLFTHTGRAYISVNPSYDTKRLPSEISKLISKQKQRKMNKETFQDEFDELVTRNVRSGGIAFGVWSSLRVPKGKWIYVECGFYYDLHPKPKNEVRKEFGMFAYLDWKGAKDEEDVEKTTTIGKKFPKEEDAQEILKGLLKKSISATEKLAPKYKKPLNRLREHLASL